MKKSMVHIDHFVFPLDRQYFLIKQPARSMKYRVAIIGMPRIMSDMLFKLITAEPDMSVIAIDSPEDSNLATSQDQICVGNVAIVNASLIYNSEFGPFTSGKESHKKHGKDLVPINLSMSNVVALTPDGKTAFKFLGIDRKEYPNISVSGFLELLKEEESIKFH